MSSKDFQQAVAVIGQLEGKFVTLAEEANVSVSFRSEMLYASTALMNNDWLATVAMRNPLSLRSAFQQVAACGLTLNPSRGFAYLVPRDNQVILDISYRGMIRMAVEDSAIKDCVVELVYSGDTFKYMGKRKSPEHTFNPFADKADRGEFVGVYVEAMLPDGRLHVEAVSAEEIYAARAASDLYRKKQKGPWVDYFSAMAKKTAIKIARKYWPQGSSRLDGAIAYLNENGEGFTSNSVPPEVVEQYMGNGSGDDIEAEAQVVDDSPQGEPEAAVAEAADVTEANPEEVNPSDLPPKVVKKVADLVKRAKAQECWEAAFEYIEGWPLDACNYAKAQLQSAQYAAAKGE